MKHTQGPWVIYPETDGTEICAVDNSAGLPIRQIIANPIRGANWIANAQLIAAAPDLLEALRPFANYACDEPCNCHNCAARRALVKATGATK